MAILVVKLAIDCSFTYIFSILYSSTNIIGLSKFVDQLFGEGILAKRKES